MEQRLERKIAFPRRPEEMPHPELPASAEANKKQKVLSVRVDPVLKMRFEQSADQNARSRREAIEAAIKLWLGAGCPA